MYSGDFRNPTSCILSHLEKHKRHLLQVTSSNLPKSELACIFLHQNHIYTELPHLFGAVPRATWEAISWVRVLILPQIKLNSQVSCICFFQSTQNTASTQNVFVINKTWYPHTMDYSFSHEKEGNPAICDNTTDLENIMLSEISQTEINRYCMISLICGI